MVRQAIQQYIHFNSFQMAAPIQVLLDDRIQFGKKLFIYHISRTFVCKNRPREELHKNKQTPSIGFMYMNVQHLGLDFNRDRFRMGLDLG